MINLNKCISAAYTRIFRLSSKKVDGVQLQELQQTDRNNFRNDLVAALCTDVNGTLTTDGIIFEIPNEELGSIFVSLNVQIKGLNYDILSAEKEYNDKITEKATKAKEKAQKSTATNKK